MPHRRLYPRTYVRFKELCNQPMCPAHWDVAPLPAAAAAAAVKNLKDPPTRERHAQGYGFEFRFGCEFTHTIPPHGEVLDLPVVCVLVPRYYTISNRIKSLKVSITKRVLQLPAGGKRADRVAVWVRWMYGVLG